MSEIQVFEGATNRTAVFTCERRSSQFEYPVPYILWSGPSRIDQDETISRVLREVHRAALAATPVEPKKLTSPWLTAPNEVLPSISKIVGQSGYKGFEGVNTGGLNSCFWVRVLEHRKDKSLLIENLHDVGRIHVERVQAIIEPDLVYPLLRGRDVTRWRAVPSAHIVLAQDEKTGKGIDEGWMKKNLPKTYAYLKHFEGTADLQARGTLRGRALYKKYFRPTDAFYSMYNVGTYTLAPFKVQWKHTGVQGYMRAAVTDGSMIGDQKVILVDFNDVTEAHYFCACINSSPAFAVIKNYIGLDASPHILESVASPKFVKTDQTHKRLAEASKLCHEAVSQNENKELLRLEAEIDGLAARIWSISSPELQALVKGLADMRDPNELDADEDDDE